MDKLADGSVLPAKDPLPLRVLLAWNTVRHHCASRRTSSSTSFGCSGLEQGRRQRTVTRHKRVWAEYWPLVSAGGWRLLCWQIRPITWTLASLRCTEDHENAPGFPILGQGADHNIDAIDKGLATELAHKGNESTSQGEYTQGFAAHQLGERIFERWC
jgi:hypothetical protein